MLRSQQVDEVLACALLLLVATGAAGAAVRARARWRVASAVLVALAAAAWLRVDRLLEGRLLLEVSPDRGLVAADLLVLPAVLLVLAGLLRARRARRR